MLPFSSILAVLGAVLVLFLSEQAFPLRKRTRPLPPRLFVNGVMSLVTFAVAAWGVRPAALSTIQWGDRTSFGLLHWLRLPASVDFVAAFLLLDLSFYYWHRANHRIAFLWRFHNVHHVDPDLDVSTGFRFHFGEVFFSTVFRAVQVALIGPSLGTFLLFETVFQIETYFHHSNLRLPAPIEKILNLVIVTPRMHGIHHSWIRSETDSNYSVIFSWWDRLHGSFSRWRAQAPRIGVPGYSAAGDNRVVRVLIAPFVRQRDYWRDR